MVVYFSDTLRSSQYNAVASTVKRLRTTHETPVMNVNDVLIIGAVPTSSIVDSVRVATDDLGTTGAAHLGLYKLTDGTSVPPSKVVSLPNNTITAIDDDYFGTLLDFATAATLPVEYRFEATPTDIDKVTKSIRDLFQSTTIGINEVYIGLKFTTATTSAGTVSALIDFS